MTDDSWQQKPHAERTHGSVVTGEFPQWPHDEASVEPDRGPMPGRRNGSTAAMRVLVDDLIDDLVDDLVDDDGRSLPRGSWLPSIRAGRLDRLLTGLWGLACGVLASATLLVARETMIGVVASLVLLAIVPGCGIVAWFSTPDRLTRVTAVVATGLSWLVLAASTLIWSKHFSGATLVATTAGAGVASCVTLIARRRAAGRALTDDGPLNGRAALPPGPGRSPAQVEAAAPPSPRDLARRWSIPVALATGIGAWLWSVLTARPVVTGEYGLLPALGVPFVVAIALTLAVLAVAMTRTWASRRLATAAVAALLVMSEGTPALLADTPISSWNYHHFGVVDYFAHGGSISDPLDVYQQWPGFFAAAAGLVKITGVSPLVYSNWVGPLLTALTALAVFALARRWSRADWRVPYVATALFVTSGWMGQRYYAPQTMTFFLSLAFFLVLIPQMTVARYPRLAPIWLHRLGAWATREAPAASPAEGGSGAREHAGHAGLALLIFAGITTAHQLSPVIVVLSLGLLIAVGVSRNVIVLCATVALEVLFVAMHFSALDHLPWLNGFHLSNATGNVLTPTSEAQEFASLCARVVALGIWGVTALAVVSYRRHLGRIFVPAVLAFAPILVLLLQNYGGEAIYRVFLFSSPWCVIIIAVRIFDATKMPGLRYPLIFSWLVVAFFASAQASTFGMFTVNRVSNAEIMACSYYLSRSPLGSTLILVASNFPSKLSAGYVDRNPLHIVNDPSMDSDPQFRRAGLMSMDAGDLADYARHMDRGPVFLVVSPAMESYSRYFGVYAPGTLREVEQELKASRAWRVWYEHDGVVIFEVRR